MSVESTRLPKSCAQCFTPEPKRQCSRCKSIVYCSGKCQKEAWELHRAVCKRNLGAKDSIDLTAKDWAILCGKEEGATEKHRELRALFSQRIPSRDELITEFEQGSMTQGEFFDLTGFYYQRDIHGAPTDFQTIPRQPFQKQKAAKQTTPLPSKFPVKICRDPKRGLALHATRKIEVGEVVCTWGGTFLKGKNASASALTHREFLNKFNFTQHSILTHRTVGGLGYLVNDGRSNTHFNYVFPKHNGPYQLVFVAIKTIQEDEEILWDYGNHACKFANYHVDEKIFQEIKGTIKRSADLIIHPEMSDYRSHLSVYATSTPHIFFRLHLESLDPLMTKKLIKNRLLELIEIDLDLFQILPALATIKDKGRAPFFLSLLEKYPVQHLYTVILHFSDKGYSEEELERFLFLLTDLSLYLRGTPEFNAYKATDGKTLLDKAKPHPDFSEKYKLLPASLQKELRGTMLHYMNLFEGNEDMRYRLHVFSSLIT